MNRTLHVADQPGPGSWRVDAGLAISACALILLGLVMVASASTSIADGKFGSSLHFFWRQSAALAVGIACGTVVALIDPRHWQRLATAGLFAGIAALSAVLIPGLGLEAGGAVRWLDLGVVTFHPGEAMKIVFVVYLAAYLAQQGEKVRLYGRYALVPISVFCLVAVLLLAEPDFGTVVVLGLTLVGMLFIAGVPFRTFAAWSAALAIAMTVLAVTEPYRLRRLLTFLAPSRPRTVTASSSSRPSSRSAGASGSAPDSGGACRSSSTSRPRIRTSCSRWSARSWAWPGWLP